MVDANDKNPGPGPSNKKCLVSFTHSAHVACPASATGAGLDDFLNREVSSQFWKEVHIMLWQPCKGAKKYLSHLRSARSASGLDVGSSPGCSHGPASAIAPS